MTLNGASVERKFMNWSFTGKPTETGEETRAYLRPGEAVVIEMLMPIADANSSLGNELLSTTGYGFKPGYQ